MDYLIEYIEWITSLGSKIQTLPLEALYLSNIQYFAKDPAINGLKYKYYQYLIKNYERKKCYNMVVNDLQYSQLDSNLVDALILCMDKNSSEVLFNQWTLFYKNLLIKHPSEKTTILLILEKLLYRKVFFDQENPTNLKLINQLLTDNKIDSAVIKENPDLGLIISLMLKSELKSLKKPHNRNYKMLLKSTLNKYLSDYDNNYLVLYQISYELNDSKWLMNSIKKNLHFQNPYNDMLSKKCENFSNYSQAKETLIRSNMKGVYCPSVQYIEFSSIYHL